MLEQFRGLGTRKIFKNFSYNLSYQIFSIILPVISIPYLTRVINQDLLGMKTLASAICSYFVLAGTLGINTFGAREIAKKQSNSETRSVAFFKICLIQLSAHTCSIGVYILYTILFSPYKGLQAILLLYLISSMFDISWLFIGMENFKDVALRNLFVKLCGFALLFIFVKSDNDIYKYVITIYAPQIIINVYMWYKTKYIIDYTLFSKVIAIDKSYLKDSFSLFLPQIASSIYTVLDKTILGLFVSYSVVATYDQAQSLLRLFLAIIPSFSKVMMPRISNSIYEGKGEYTEKLLEMSAKFIWGLSFLIFFGVIACSDFFVDWYLPESYSDAAIIIKICAPIILAVSGSNLISIQYLIPIGKQKIYTASIAAAAVINCILNFILVPIIGVYGICIASVTAEFIGFFIQVYFVQRYLKVIRLFGSLPVYTISGAVMFIMLLWIKKFFSPNIVNTFLLAVTGTVLYICTYFVVDKIVKLTQIVTTK